MDFCIVHLCIYSQIQIINKVKILHSAVLEREENASVRVLVNDVDDDVDDAVDDDGKWRVTERVLGGDVESPVLAACTPVTRPPTQPCNQPR